MEAQEEEYTEEGINYVAMRNLFVREASEALHSTVEKKTRTTQIRESAERVTLSKTVSAFDSLKDFCPIKVSLMKPYKVPHATLRLHSLATDGRVVRVPQEDEPRQPHTPSGVYRQAPWANCLGGQQSQAALHRGWMAQAQDRLVRHRSKPSASTR